MTEHDQVVSERDSKEEEDQREDMHDSLQSEQLSVESDKQTPVSINKLPYFQ